MLETDIARVLLELGYSATWDVGMLERLFGYVDRERREERIAAMVGMMVRTNGTKVQNNGRRRSYDVFFVVVSTF